MSAALVRDGLRIQYDVSGTGDVAALFAHGLTGTGAADWRRLLPALEPHFRCVVPDLRGHGRSDYRDGAVSVEAIGEDLHALIEHEQMGQPHLVGFSMGAELSLSLELAKPGTARSLVLIGPSTGCPSDRGGYGAITGDPPHWPQLLRQLHDEHNLGDMKPVFEVVESPGGLYIGARRNAENGNYYWRVTQWVMPAFTMIPPRADHPVHVQRADAVNALVRDFLLDVDAMMAAPG